MVRDENAMTKGVPAATLSILTHCLVDSLLAPALDRRCSPLPQLVPRFRRRDCVGGKESGDFDPFHHQYQAVTLQVTHKVSIAMPPGPCRRQCKGVAWGVMTAWLLGQR